MFSKLLPLLTVAVTVNAAAHAATADDEMIADLANLALSCVAFQAVRCLQSRAIPTL
jgi:hypothetical protein